MSSFNVSSTEIPVVGGILSKAAEAAMSEGAVVLAGSDFDTIALPAGAGATGILGVARNAALAAGDRVSVMTMGQANVLLAASASCTEGAPVIAANSSGHIKGWTNETACDVLGTAMVTRTAGSSAEMVPVLLRVYQKT